jgi:thioesterase domain-containing protein/acyl carrier protein
MSSSDVAADSSKPAEPSLDRRNVEGLFALRPLQRALLFHRTLGSDDPGFIQARMTLEGSLDESAFESAWRQILARHAALRMSLHQAGGESRVVTWRDLPLPWSTRDLRDASEETRQARLCSIVEEDRRAGIDLHRPPAMRLTVIRLGDDTTEVVWSCHHLFLDGWSTAIVIDEVMRVYHAIKAGRESPLDPVVGSYSRYLEWIRRQDPGEAERFWRTRLEGVTDSRTLHLGRSAGTGNGPPFAKQAVELDQSASQVLAQAGAEQRLTPNTLLQGAWGLLLGTLLGSDDVLFGATVSGRGAGVAGLETLVGLFASVVPVRVGRDRAMTVQAWLTGLRNAQFEAQAFEHNDLEQIQVWTRDGRVDTWFESLLVVENFPWQSSAGGNDDVAVRSFRSDVTSTYPITITAIPGESWRLWCQFDRCRFDPESVRALLELLGETLHRIASRPEAPLSECIEWLESHRLLPGLRSERANERCAQVRASGARFDLGRASERLLTRIWEDALGVEGIGLDDNFFELGGRSITALRVLSQVEERFGSKLPLSAVLEHPTVRCLAPLAEQPENPDTWKSLVQIQTGGSRPPLFFVHGGAQEVFLFRSVAHHLGPDQPVFVLQAIGADGQTTPPETIEDMAAHYVNNLRSVQARGPYRIIGYCFGATVAFEMARQLRRAGEEITLLGIMDAVPPLLRKQPVTEKAVRFVRRVHGFVQRRGLSEAAVVAAQRAVKTARAKLLGRHDRQPDRVLGRREAEMVSIRRTFRTAFLAYRPEPIDIPAMMIRSEDNPWLDTQYTPRDWEKLVPSVETHIVQGSHVSMLFDPAAERVAKILEAASVVTGAQKGPTSAPNRDPPG